MTKQELRQLQEDISEIESGSTGIVLVITEESITDYGNDFDAETLLKALKVYVSIIEDQVYGKDNLLKV